MTRLRRTLEQELPTIDVRRHLIVRRGIVCLEHVRIDACEFRRLADKAMWQVAAGELWQAEVAFSSAFSLWQGSFLPGSFGVAAAAAWQDELERLYLEASQQFARLLAERGRCQEAVKLLSYALRYNPAHDELVRLLCQLLLALEQPAQAQQLRDQYAAVLAGKQLSAGEIDRILGSFPTQPPPDGWLGR
jgi:two-component SAPR family response regulator